jgi:hypothetical protein
MATRNNNHPSKMWFYCAALSSLVIVLLNLYYALHANHENCVQPSTQELHPHDSTYNHWSNNNHNLPDTVPIDFTPLVAHIKQKQIPKRTVVVFTCNEAYGRAVASSVISVRIDGGYEGDVAILMEQSQNLTFAWMQQEIQHEHKIQRQQRQNQEQSRKNATISKENEGNHYHDNPLHRVFIFSTDELWDSLLSWSSSSTKQAERNISSSSSSLSIADLRNTPPAGWCMPPKRMSGHRGYFLKTLIYHPIMAERWDIVLCESNGTCQSVVMTQPIQFKSSGPGYK